MQKQRLDRTQIVPDDVTSANELSAMNRPIFNPRAIIKKPKIQIDPTILDTRLIMDPRIMDSRNVAASFFSQK